MEMLADYMLCFVEQLHVPLMMLSKLKSNSGFLSFNSVIWKKLTWINN